MQKRGFKIILIIIFLVILGYYNEQIVSEIDYFYDDSNDFNLNPYRNTIYNNHEYTNQSIKVIFCPSNDCYLEFNKLFENAKYEIKCAFYDFNELNLSKTLLKKSEQDIKISLIIDNDYLLRDSIKEFSNTKIQIYSDINRGTKYNNYMHHKFCVIDENILITGSTNPTDNGFFKNNNNLLLINSKSISKNYLNEFNQMKNNVFGYNKKPLIDYNNVTIITDNNNYTISSYMCPQDNCINEIVEILDNAKEEILFATFAITHDDVSNKLIEKSLENLEVIGIIEKRNFNLLGSDAKNLSNYFNLYNDTNKYNMHHKFFVIDKNIVITGSMNPSLNGDKYNDENILIIHNKEIAKMYRDEIFRLIK